ncbi:UDP-GlcNAc--UDP-phosphate GlcNAc-1-phosphate transferase [Flagellimonas sp. DF-77]|uniref:UDP-GlcNAc--UDP-phosphate GlcNAc-1-phosphate transferase n=1 Tax=Flagellimonas algarum TaxID=3230298 RepID=UPI003398A727
MILGSCVLILIITAFLYSKVAIRFNIVDNPNFRSSHTIPTIRGAGILFVFACLLFFLFYGFQYPYFIGGLVLIASVSFVDDIITLGSGTRLIAQFAAIAALFFEIEALQELPLLYLAVLLVLSLGFINIFNFMDGINGITGIYALSVLIPLWYANHYIATYTSEEFLWLLMLSILIFGYSNFRKKAKVFAGDVGSVSLGLTLVFLLTRLAMATEHYYYFMFVFVYALDGGFTILERLLYQKENIFKPHRRHLYQLMTDTLKMPHMLTSLYYGVAQLLISAGVIFAVSTGLELWIFVAIPLVTVLYALFKFKLQRQKKMA